MKFFKILLFCSIVCDVYTEQSIDFKVEVPEHDLFTPNWVNSFKNHDTGCSEEISEGGYYWRMQGLGSNLNILLDDWLYYLSVNKWNDISIICENCFKRLECFNESMGAASVGWDCLFGEIPHLCVFETYESWEQDLLSKNLSYHDAEYAKNITDHTLRISKKREIMQYLENSTVSYIGALSVMADYLWSYMTPWMRRDIDLVKESFKNLEDQTSLGIHIRRGDKLLVEADFVNVTSYLDKTLEYFDESTIRVEDIRAIWVASDDPNAVNELRDVSSMYFPNLNKEDIIYASNEILGGNGTEEVVTHTGSQGYQSLVHILADIEKLAETDVFIGTFSSNIGRFVTVLRELRGKPFDSALSMDVTWHPGRK